MKNSENLGKTDSKKPKYNPKLIGVVASEKGPIKDIAAKYQISQYFVRQSRETAREYGFRVYRDKLSDGEKHAIIDDSYKDRSAKEISESLGGISTSTIYHVRKEFSNGYNQPDDNSNVVRTQNLEGRVVGRIGRIVRVKIGRKAVGNGDEVVGINEFEVRNEDASQGVGGEPSVLGTYSDERLKSMFPGDSPQAVRGYVARHKGQKPELSELDILGKYVTELRDRLTGNVQSAMNKPGYEPGERLGLLQQCVEGIPPNDNTFDMIRQQAQAGIAKYRPMVASPAPAQPELPRADAEAADFFNKGAGGAPSAPPAVPAAQPAPAVEPAAAQAPAAPVAEPEPPLVSLEPRGDDAGHREPAATPRTGDTQYIDLPGEALEVLGRRYEDPDMAVVAEVASRHIRGKVLNARGFFGELDGKLKSKEPTEGEMAKVYSLNDSLDAKRRELGEIKWRHGITQKDRKEEIASLTQLLGDIDVEKRDYLYGCLRKKVYDYRDNVIEQCRPLKRLDAWWDRNYKAGLKLAGLGLAGVALWAGMQAFDSLERRVGNLYTLPAVTKQINNAKNYNAVVGQQVEQGKRIGALEGKVAEGEGRQNAYEETLKRLNADMKKADNDNLKLVKDYVDSSKDDNQKAHDALAAQQKTYETQNAKEHGEMRGDIAGIKGDVKKLGEVKVAPVAPTGPVAAPLPTPTPSPGPAIGPQPNPNPEAQPEPQPQAEKSYEGSTTIRAEGLSGDVSGHQLRTSTLFSLGNEYQFKLDALERNEKQTLNGEDVKRTSFYAMPELNIIKDDGLYEFNFKGNHAQSNETRDGKSSSSDLINEAGLSILTRDNSAWRQKTDNTLDSFSLDAKVQKFHLFGDVSSNRTKTDYKGDTDVTVSELGNAFPPFVVNNDVRTTTEATTNSYKLGAGWDFGSVEPGIIGRHNASDWKMNGELNGAPILDKKGDSSQDTLGVYTRFNFDNKVAGRFTILGNSGDDLDSSQKLEGAAHGTALVWDKLAVGLGGERSDGGAKGRAALLWKTNDDKAGWQILQETNNFMNSAEEANLFPEATSADQKRWARMDRDMSAGASGLFLAAEGGKEGVDKGTQWRVDAAAPIPGTKGKAFTYGSFEDGETFRFVEGGVGYKPNKWLELGWNYWDSKDKETDVHTTGTGPSITVKW